MRTFQKKCFSLSLTLVMLTGCGANTNPADPGLMMPPMNVGMNQQMQPFDPMAPQMDQFGQPLDAPVDTFAPNDNFDAPADDTLIDEAPPSDFNPEDTSSDLDDSLAPPPPSYEGGEEEAESPGGIKGALSKVTAIAGPVIEKVKGVAGPAVQVVKGIATPLIGKLTSIFKGGDAGDEAGSGTAVSFGNPNGFGNPNLVTVSGQLQVATSKLGKLFNSKPNKEIWVRVELDGFVRESMTDAEGAFSVQFKELNLVTGEKKATVSLSNLNTKDLSSSPIEVTFSIN